MTQKTNSFDRFWKELKRRKTGKVIVAYAATAFIILQLVDILTPAFLLPEWTTRLVTLILIVGFPVAAIFSWVFDITPEGIKKSEIIEESEKKELVKKSQTRILSLSNMTIAVLLVAVGILAYHEVFKKGTIEELRAKGRFTVAVIPFQNMTSDTTWNVWQEGIQSEIITSLTNSRELKVRQTESTNNLINGKGFVSYASINQSAARNISRKLDADILICGNIKESRNRIRLVAQLIDPGTGDALKSFQLDGMGENILKLADSLSTSIRNFLVISVLQKKVSLDIGNFSSTNSPEAFRYFIYGENAYSKYNFAESVEWMLKAIESDSGFMFPYITICGAYYNTGMYENSREICIKIYNKRNQLSDKEKIFANVLHAFYFETPEDQVKYFLQMFDLDDQQPLMHYQLGLTYQDLDQNEKAVEELRRALGIYKKWGIKPFWSANYSALGKAYHNTGQYKQEIRLYKKAEKDFPADSRIIYRQIVLALSRNNINEANRSVEKYKFILKQNSKSEADIATGLAGIYDDSGIPDMAEKYYRTALSYEPSNPEKLNNLAWFLIDKDRNAKEGMVLIKKALDEKKSVLSPDDYFILDTKGWGLYKQGKYQEALRVLQECDSLKPLYDHVVDLHLEAAKKAVARMK